MRAAPLVITPAPSVGGSVEAVLAGVADPLLVVPEPVAVIVVDAVSELPGAGVAEALAPVTT
jgi:hypothetical protein